LFSHSWAPLFGARGRDAATVVAELEGYRRCSQVDDVACADEMESDCAPRVDATGSNMVRAIRKWSPSLPRDGFIRVVPLWVDGSSSLGYRGFAVCRRFSSLPATLPLECACFERSSRMANLGNRRLLRARLSLNHGRWRGGDGRDAEDNATANVSTTWGDRIYDDCAMTPHVKPPQSTSLCRKPGGFGNRSTNSWSASRAVCIEIHSVRMGRVPRNESESFPA